MTDSYARDDGGDIESVLGSYAADLSLDDVEIRPGGQPYRPEGKPVDVELGGLIWVKTVDME